MLPLALGPQRGRKDIPGHCCGAKWTCPHLNSHLLSSGDTFTSSPGAAEVAKVLGDFLVLIQHQHSRDTFRGWAGIPGLGWELVLEWLGFGKLQLFNSWEREEMMEK